MVFPNNLTPVEICFEYVKRVLKQNIGLTIDEVRKVFLYAINDYDKKNIDEHTLMIIASQIYSVGNQSRIDTHDTELGDALMLASELIYDSSSSTQLYDPHVGNLGDKRHLRVNEEELQQVLQYFTQHKHEIQKVSVNQKDGS